MTGPRKGGNVSAARQQRGASAWRRGIRAEAWAALWLRLKGYSILETRYKTSVGEIDLIAARGRTIAFVEVKTRASEAEALEAVSVKSRERIARAAAWYGARSRLTAENQRFDVIIVRNWSFPRHIVNAWGA